MLPVQGLNNCRCELRLINVRSPVIFHMPLRIYGLPRYHRLCSWAFKITFIRKYRVNVGDHYSHESPWSVKSVKLHLRHNRTDGQTHGRKDTSLRPSVCTSLRWNMTLKPKFHLLRHVTLWNVTTRQSRHVVLVVMVTCRVALAVGLQHARHSTATFSYTKMHGLDSESWRVATWRNKWNLGLSKHEAN